MFRLSAPTNRYLYVRVRAGLPSEDGYALPKPAEHVVRLGATPKGVKLLAPGSLLALSGERKVSVLVRAVAAIEVDAYRLLPGAVHHLISQTTGSIDSPEFMHYSFGENDLGERIHEERSFPTDSPGVARYTALDFGAMAAKKGEVPRGR